MNKQHILDEIRRTATDNKGQPLGRMKFFKQTGIKESDWIGKFWIRWGDAVQEAGFEPNEKQSAFEENTLLELFIELMRELGHFPVAAELRMKAHNDDTFPNPKTFRRFGLKNQLIVRVKSYCERRTGYEDVAAMCPVLTGAEGNSEGETEHKDAEPFGFVYLLKSGRYYKIGHSNAVGRRERELAILLPDPANTVHSIRTDDPAGIEDYWHQRFAVKRKNGEWFELDASDVKAFRRRVFM
jgi:hypothetical protein